MGLAAGGAARPLRACGWRQLWGSQEGLCGQQGVPRGAGAGPASGVRALVHAAEMRPGEVGPGWSGEPGDVSAAAQGRESGWPGGARGGEAWSRPALFRVEQMVLGDRVALGCKGGTQGRGSGRGPLRAGLGPVQGQQAGGQHAGVGAVGGKGRGLFGCPRRAVRR